MSHLQYHCDSCSLTIPPSNPRVHCLVCADYDLCANCYLGERSIQGHQIGHQTSVFRQCGGVGQHPVPASVTYSTVPPGQSPSQGYQGNTQVLPPPVPSRLPNASPPHGSGLTPPPPAPNTSTGWQPFFHPDSSPTPLFIKVVNDIFTYLDPNNTGNLVPETFSRFLNDMGYQAHENAWRQGLVASYNASKETMADKSLKSAFDLFSIEHVLLQRAPPASQRDSTRGLSSFKRALGSAFTPSTGSNSGPMPCITRNGLVELCRVAMLTDPSKEWGNFSRMLRKYNLPQYRGWGDLPRSVLPAMPDAAMIQRNASIAAFANQKAKEQLDALHMSAMINARGNQIAVDAISGGRTEYTYRYY